MKWRDGTLLLLLGMGTAVLAALRIASPGYMDADYYYAMGVQWARGAGDFEPFLWNYLSESPSIPTPSHAYWPPLSAIVSSMAIRVLGEGFRSAQFPFILATTWIPFMVWRLALRFQLDDRSALLAGMLASAPGFFLPYFVTTDVFSLYVLIGIGLTILLQHDSHLDRPLNSLFVGILCGLAHLGRAEGFILLSVPVIVILTTHEGRRKKFLFLAAGYSLVMAPWFLRNYAVFGSLIGPGGTKSLWLLSYDELFTYPASTLTFQRWWDAGVGDLVLHRWEAIRIVAQRILAENGLIFLTPFMVIGLIKTWEVPVVRAIVYYLALLFIVMALIFPFAGARGGWFHSSAVVMPLLWTMAPIGLKVSVNWVGQRRNWDRSRSQVVFGVSMALLAFIFTWALYLVRVLGMGGEGNRWDEPSARYREIALFLTERDEAPGVVAANNPPGFFHTTGFPSVVLPNGDLNVLQQVVRQYDIGWILLDENHPAGLEDLYNLSVIPDWVSHEYSIESHNSLFNLFRVGIQER